MICTQEQRALEDLDLIKIFPINLNRNFCLEANQHAMSSPTATLVKDANGAI
jgi:hypothetical protein